MGVMVVSVLMGEYVVLYRYIDRGTWCISGYSSGEMFYSSSVPYLT